MPIRTLWNCVEMRIFYKNPKYQLFKGIDKFKGVFFWIKIQWIPQLGGGGYLLLGFAEDWHRNLVCRKGPYLESFILFIFVLFLFCEGFPISSRPSSFPPTGGAMSRAVYCLSFPRGVGSWGDFKRGGQGGVQHARVGSSGKLGGGFRGKLWLINNQSSGDINVARVWGISFQSNAEQQQRTESVRRGPLCPPPAVVSNPVHAPSTR